MSTKAKIETVVTDSAGGVRSEPGGRAQQPAGGAPTIELPLELREQLTDEVIDQLLAGARTEEEIAGPGGVLAQLTEAAGGARPVGGGPYQRERGDSNPRPPA